MRLILVLIALAVIHFTAGCAYWRSRQMAQEVYDEYQALKLEQETTPTGILEGEHAIAILVINAAETQASLTNSASGALDAEKVAQMTGFFENYLDRCHHAKEEQCLFPQARLRNVPASPDFIKQLEWEHEVGRKLIGGIRNSLPAAETGNPEATARIGRLLAAYAALMKSHIARENKDLFPQIKAALTPDDSAEIVSQFEMIEKEILGPAAHEDYERLASQLAVWNEAQAGNNK